LWWLDVLPWTEMRNRGAIGPVLLMSTLGMA